MKLKLLLFSVFFSFSWVSFSQNLTQYFDGADTSIYYGALLIDLDTSSANTWQIGPPQKVIFDSAATNPNVIITDTINSYPVNNTSVFYTTLDASMWGGPGIGALQWKQKLDLDTNHDGGIIEFSDDGGATWHNAFNNPYVYNFYGFDPVNQDTLATGEYAFSGTDSVWRDIWLCFDFSFYFNDTISARFTMKSDSVDQFREGWMIDNMIAHITIIHTVSEKEQDEYLRVYPSVTSGLVNIEAIKLPEYHVIENMELISTDGRTIETFGKAPVKFYIDISKHAAGMYYLKVTTNKKTQTFPVMLKEN